MDLGMLGRKAAHGLELKKDFRRNKGRQSKWKGMQELRRREWEDQTTFKEKQPTFVGTQSMQVKLLGSQPEI